MANTPNIYDGHHPDVSIPQIGSKIEEIEKKIGGGGGGVACPHLVGSVLMFNSPDIDPNAVWAGTTWENVGTDCYLVGSGTHEAGSSGGSNSRTLTTANLPQHSHGITDHAHDVYEHSHSLNSHTHSFSDYGTTDTDGSHRHYGYFREGYQGSSSSTRIALVSSASTDREDSANPITQPSEGSHSHSFSVSGTTGGASGYTGYGGAGSTDYAGLTATNNAGTPSAQLDIAPKYYSVCIWTRTA